MLMKVDDKTATAILLARKNYSENMKVADKESRAEMDRLLLEGANYAVMLMVLGGLLVTDDKLQAIM